MQDDNVGEWFYLLVTKLNVGTPLKKSYTTKQVQYHFIATRKYETTIAVTLLKKLNHQHIGLLLFYSQTLHVDPM